MYYHDVNSKGMSNTTAETLVQPGLDELNTGAVKL